MQTLTDAQVSENLDELLLVGKQAVTSGLTQASGGNLSIRTADEEMYVTGKGTWLDRLERGHFAHMDFAGNLLSDTTPSSEWKLHSTIYRKREDARAIIHVHPQYSLLLTALGKRIRFLTQDHAFYVGSYGVTKYYTNGSDELAETAAAEVADGRHDVVILGNHGIAALGTSVESAMRTALNLEEAAKLTYHALLLGDEDTVFPPDELEKLHHS